MYIKQQYFEKKNKFCMKPSKSEGFNLFKNRMSTKIKSHQTICTDCHECKKNVLNVLKNI